MAPLARSSLLGALLGGAYASETCAASDTCSEESTLLQGGLRAVSSHRANKAKASHWPQHEVDKSKCNLNVDMAYVADQEECEALAVTNGHPYYSFRHNGEDAGHRCMSSADCGTDLIGDRTNDWNIYAEPAEAPPVSVCSPSFEVLSNDHDAQGDASIGKYFNFDLSSAAVSLGRSLVNGEVLWAFSYGSWRQVIVWPSANYGSVGDAHGRLNDGAAAGDWQVGDHLTFAPLEGIAVLSIDHAHGDASIGKYFHFHLSSAAEFLGRPLVSGGEVLWAFNEGSWRQVIIWDRANGGSVGDAHGRLNDGAAAGDWEVGDHISFARDPTVEVLSNDHSKQGDASIGKYFNFNQAAAEESVGRPLGDDEVLWSVSARNGAQQVKIWTSANTGSVGECAGRFNDGAAAGDWEVGDLITLLPLTQGGPPSFDC